MRHLSFLARLTLFGFLLSALPVLFIGVISYVTSTHEIEKHVVRSKMQLLRQTNANVEQILSTVNHTLNQLVSSTVVRKAITDPLNVESFVTYNELRNELGHLQAFDTKVQDVILVNAERNWIVKNSGRYALDDYPYTQELMSMMRIPDSTSWVLNPSEWFHGEGLSVRPACPYNISLVKKLPPNSLEKAGFVAANIPACALQEVIQVELEEEGSQLMIVDDQMRLLLHPDPALIGRPVAESGSVTESHLEAAASGDQLGLEVDGRAYTMSYYRSGLNGWYYISVVSIDSITQEAGKIGRYTLYICLGLLLLSLAIAWAGSRRMYSPIGKLLTQIAPGGRREGVDELQYISEHVRELFSSKTALEQQLRQQLPQVRTLYLIKAYQGQVKRSTLEQRLRQYGYAEQLDAWQAAAVITLQIDSLEQTRYDKDDMELLLYAMDNILGESVPPEHLAAPVVIDMTAVAMIGHTEREPELFATFLYGLTERLQQRIESYLGLQVSIGISLPFTELTGLHSAYREGLDALRQRMKLGGGVIIQYSDVNSGRHHLQTDYPRQREAELLDAIKLAEPERADELLGRLMGVIFQAEMSPQEYEVPLNRLLNNLLTMMQESGIAMHQLQASGSLYAELRRRQTATEIEEWFREAVVLPLIAIFRDRQEEQYHNISEQIIALIHGHYDTDLTLEQCAAQLHYNANYLSSVFRKETGVSFSEYLSNYRFAIAKKWLLDTDMPVKEIAARLRYTNSQNFIRSFRKQEGMTPGQYRDNSQRL